MKHYFFCFLLLCLSTIIFADEEIPLIFATGEWPPMSSEYMTEYGAATEIISAACKEAGIKPIYKFYPWPRAEKIVENGKAFAAFPYGITKERQQKHYISNALFHGADVFVYYKPNLEEWHLIKFDKLEELKEFRIGVLRGTYYEPSLKRSGIDYETSTTMEQSIHKLVLNRIDLFLDDQVAIFHAAERLYPDKLKSFGVLEKAFGEKSPSVLIVSRKYPESRNLLDKFNKGLEAIQKNGEHKRIIDKYHMAE